MHKDLTYLFKSKRLGFRNWQASDFEKMCAINSDEKVMEFFPALPTKDQTMAFVERMSSQFENKGYCYYAVDKLEENDFIGFIGLSEQNYEARFTPCIDIGWRLKITEWNKGFATEGANACIDYAFNILKLKSIFSVASKANKKSEHIMKKLGMQKQYEFEHPLLANDERLKTCVLYRIDSAN